MKKLIQISVLLVLAFAMANCHKSGRRYYYQQPWYDVYGNYCGSGQPQAGCNFYSTGLKIIDIEDPYFASNYNLNYYILEPYYDSYGYLDFYTGWAWYSPTGIFYADSGYALNATKEKGLDVVAQVAEEEKKVVTKAAKGFAEKYALNAAVASDISNKMYRRMKDFSDTRTFTKEKEEQYVYDLTGVKLDDLRDAAFEAKKGNLKPAKEVNGVVAAYWKTSPEGSAEVLRSWYGELFKEYESK